MIKINNQVKEKISHSFGILRLSLLVFPIFILILFILKMILDHFFILSIILSLCFSICIYTIITREFGYTIDRTTTLSKLGKITVKVLNIKVIKKS